MAAKSHEETGDRYGLLSCLEATQFDGASPVDPDQLDYRHAAAARCI